MIIDAIFGTLFKMVGVVAAKIPILDFSDLFNASEDVGMLWKALSYVSCFMPVNTMMHVLIGVIALYSLSFSFAIFNWLIAKIPGIN